MTTVIALLALVGAAVALYLLLAGGRDPKPPTKEEIVHRSRLAELRWAYELAAEELDREPTTEEIFMARDTLKELQHGTTGRR